MKKLFALIIFGVLMGTVVKIESHDWLRLNFVDEQDNFVIADNLIKGNKIYTNLFSHHQPGAYLASAIIQKTLKPNTILSLVKQHRQVIALWSMGWIWFLVWRFGPIMVAPLITLELIKKIYLGNMFLAESIVLGPMIYLTISFLKNEDMAKIGVFLVGGLLVGVGLTLAPMWPLLMVIGLGWIYRWRRDKSRVFLMIAGAILILALTVSFIDVRGYLENAIAINQKYYIPMVEGNNWGLSLFKAILTPFRYLLNGVYGLEVVIIKIMILALGVKIVDLIRKKDYRQIGRVVGILTLANLRDIELGKMYYEGFHLLIWVGLIMTIPLVGVGRGWKTISGLVVVGLVAIKGLAIINSPNYSQDFEIYYSRIYNMSEAIRATKADADRLLSMPDEVLPFWQAGIKPAGKYVFFYEWMGGVEQLRERQLADFRSGPEYLIVKDDQGLGLGEEIERYQNFRYREGENSEFFIRKDVYDNFSEEKINKLKYYGLEAI